VDRSWLPENPDTGDLSNPRPGAEMWVGRTAKMSDADAEELLELAWNRAATAYGECCPRQEQVIWHTTNTPSDDAVTLRQVSQSPSGPIAK
jgi:hypothetical protein